MPYHQLQSQHAPEELMVGRWTREMMDGGYRPPGRGIASVFNGSLDVSRGVPSMNTSTSNQQQLYQQQRQQQQQSAWTAPAGAQNTMRSDPSPGLWSKVKGAFRSGKPISASEGPYGTLPPKQDTSVSIENVWQQQQQHKQQQQQQQQGVWNQATQQQQQMGAMGWPPPPPHHHHHQQQQQQQQGGVNGEWYRELQAGIHQQYMLSAPVVVPAPVIMDILSQVHRSNELLRRESQARSHGMRSLVEAVNRNLAVTDELVAAAGGGSGAAGDLRRAARPLASRPALWPPPHSAADGGGLGLDEKLRRQDLLPHRRLGPEAEPARQPYGLGSGSRGSAWSAPSDASSLVKKVSALPGQKWSEALDLRVGSWNLQGLGYRGPDDQHAIEVVAQALWACQFDIVALLGLAGPGAAPKVCALFNLWDLSDGEETWRYCCSPPAAPSRDAGYRGVPPECAALLWREPAVEPWGGSGLLRSRPSSYASSSTPSHGVEQEGQLPGSFLAVEAGVKGGFGALLSRDVFMGVFAVRQRPVVVVAVSLPPGGAEAQGDRKHLGACLQAASREVQARHTGLSGRMWTIVVGTFNCDPALVLDAASWEFLLDEGTGTQLKTMQHCDDICASKSVFGGSKLPRDDRPMQPITRQGEVGDYARPPFRSDVVALQPQLQCSLPGHHALVWGEVRVISKPDAGTPLVKKPTADSPRSTSRAELPPYGGGGGAVTGEFDSRTSSPARPTAAVLTRPQSYVDALTSDPLRAARTPYGAASASTAGNSGGRGGGYGLDADVSTLSGKAAVNGRGGGDGGYGLDADVSKLSSKTAVSGGGGGGYGLDADVSNHAGKAAGVSGARPGLRDEVSTGGGYGLYDEVTRAKPAALPLRQHSGQPRVLTPEGPSTPLMGSPQSGSPRASVDNVRASGVAASSSYGRPAAAVGSVVRSAVKY